MAITEKQFKGYLMLYGASVESWPEAIRIEAMRMASCPPIRGLLIDQRRFEELLHRSDVTAPASPWLAKRIIHAAGGRPSRIAMIVWLEELLVTVLPRPAFALATVLTLGLIIGFTLPQAGTKNIEIAYLDDASL